MAKAGRKKGGKNKVSKILKNHEAKMNTKTEKNEM